MENSDKIIYENAVVGEATADFIIKACAAGSILRMGPVDHMKMQVLDPEYARKDKEELQKVLARTPPAVSPS